MVNISTMEWFLTQHRYNGMVIGKTSAQWKGSWHNIGTMERFLAQHRYNGTVLGTTSAQWNGS